MYSTILLFLGDMRLLLQKYMRKAPQIICNLQLNIILLKYIMAIW